MIYALDSNIISYFLKKDTKIRKKLATETNAGNQFTMSTVVYFEVERWLLETGAVKNMQNLSECAMTFLQKSLIWMFGI